jgi:hypothetical protein
VVHPDNGVVIQYFLEMSYEAMKRYGGNVKTYYSVKEDN